MIKFDPRGHTKILEHLQRLGAPCDSSSQNEYGDVVFPTHDVGTVGIEIKTVDHLLAAIRDNSLSAQLVGLSDTVDIPVLMCYGFLTNMANGECRTNTGVKAAPRSPTYTGVISAILSWEMHGITVLPIVSNEFMMARVILSMYQWFQETKHESLFKREKPFVIGDKESVQDIYMLSGIRGISVGTATKLLEHFGCVRGVLGASLDELMEVRGIGEVIANNVFQAGRHQFRTKQKRLPTRHKELPTKL